MKVAYVYHNTQWVTTPPYNWVVTIYDTESDKITENEYTDEQEAFNATNGCKVISKYIFTQARKRYNGTAIVRVKN